MRTKPDVLGEVYANLGNYMLSLKFTDDQKEIINWKYAELIRELRKGKSKKSSFVSVLMKMLMGNGDL